jgi:hypothetical protein
LDFAHGQRHRPFAVVALHNFKFVLLSFVEYRRGVTNRRQGALHGWAQRRGFSADIDVSTFGVHRGDFTHDFVANLFIYYERRERGGVSTTRDDRSVGLRRRGKRKAAAAAKELLLIFPYPLAFAKT